MDKLEYFKRELNKILDKQLKELDLKQTVSKAIFDVFIDSIEKSRSNLVKREVWATNKKTGKNYRTTVWVNPDKVNGLKRYSEQESTGAKIAITKLKRAIDKCKTEKDLMNLVLRNRDRFCDKNGRSFPIVKELHNYVKAKSNKIGTISNKRFLFSSMTDLEKEEKKHRILTKIVSIVQKDFVPYNNDGAFDKAATNWLKINPIGNAYTDIGEVIINGKSVVRDMHHGDTHDKYLKLQTLPAVKDILESGTYLGYERDFSGKNISNHYFAGKIYYGNEEKIVFCRVRETDGLTSRFYVHEVFTEDEIKKAVHVPVINGSLPQLIGKPLYKFILQDVLNVNDSVKV